MKTTYKDSKGISHEIEKMPSIMIFYTVMKYGKTKLAEEGYDLIIERFDNIVKNGDIVNIINNLGGKND